MQTKRMYLVNNEPNTFPYLFNLANWLLTNSSVDLLVIVINSADIPGSLCIGTLVLVVVVVVIGLSSIRFHLIALNDVK